MSEKKMEADETWKFLSAYALVLCAESVTLLTIYFRLGFLQARKLPNGLFLVIILRFWEAAYLPLP